MPIFTVVVPLFNNQATIANTLERLSQQSLANFEAVIVDDGSTDSSSQIVRSFKDPRIRLISQDNRGPAAARNCGIEAANADWIAFLDADDLWHTEHLSELYKIIQAQPEAVLIGTAFAEIRNDIQLEPLTRDLGTIAAIRFFRRVGEGRPPFFTSSTAARTKELRELGGFADFRIGEDRELWSRIALDHVVAASTRCTVGYLKQADGIMGSAGHRWPSMELRSVSEIAPAVATVERRIENIESAQLRSDLEKFIDRYVRYVLSSSIVHADVTTLRQLARLFRGAPSRREKAYLLLARLPSPVAKAFLRLRGRISRLRTHFRKAAPA